MRAGLRSNPGCCFLNEVSGEGCFMVCVSPGWVSAGRTRAWGGLRFFRITVLEPSLHRRSSSLVLSPTPNPALLHRRLSPSPPPCSPHRACTAHAAMAKAKRRAQHGRTWPARVVLQGRHHCRHRCGGGDSGGSSSGFPAGHRPRSPVCCGSAVRSKGGAARIGGLGQVPSHNELATSTCAAATPIGELPPASITTTPPGSR